MEVVPKLDKEVKRIALIAPLPWLKRIDDWRRKQPDMPNVSQAIRRLVELGLEAEKRR
jgi:hypothetical protein